MPEPRLPQSPTSRVEAYAMLAQHALSSLWGNSDFQPREAGDELWGCCPRCCVPCGALLYLDREGVLDAVLREWDEGMRFSPIVGGLLDREWLYQQWSNPVLLEQCEHEAVLRG